MAKIPIYTINTYDFQNEKALGILTANSVHMVSLGRHIGAVISGIFGGDSSLIEKKIQDIVDAAKEEFLKKISIQYPNATSVIGYTVIISETIVENDSLTYAKGAYNIASGIASLFGGKKDIDIDESHKGGGDTVWTPVFVATVTGTAIGPL